MVQLTGSKGRMLLDLIGRAGHETCALNDIPEALIQLRQVAVIGITQGVGCNRMVADHIGGAGIFCNGVVHSGAVHHMLTHELHTVKGKQHGIRCASALMGRTGSMCLNAVKIHTVRPQCHAATGNASASAGSMGSQRHIQLLEAAVITHNDLAAEALLGRCAVNGDGKGNIRTLQHIFKGNRCTDGRRTLHMVTAGMTLVFQRIIFAQKADIRAAFAVRPGGTVGGVQTADGVLHFKALLFQLVLQETRCKHRFITQLRLIEDLKSQVV